MSADEVAHPDGLPPHPHGRVGQQLSQGGTERDHHAIVLPSYPREERLDGTEGKESLEMAKQILSEGSLQRQIAEGTSKGVHGKLVEVDGPTALWTTTTRVRTDYELSNRVFELTPDDSRPQTRSIIKNVFEEDRTEVDFELVKALFTWIAG